MLVYIICMIYINNNKYKVNILYLRELGSPRGQDRGPLEPACPSHALLGVIGAFGAFGVIAVIAAVAVVCCCVCSLRCYRCWTAYDRRC